MADDGNVLGSHCCSDEFYMRHDLGMESAMGPSNWKHENYDKHFGKDGWELVWVDDPKTHAGLQAAYALNQQLGDEAKRKEKEVMPRIELVISP